MYTTNKPDLWFNITGKKNLLLEVDAIKQINEVVAEILRLINYKQG